MDDRVQFAGVRNDVERFLQRSDIFVCPSLWEEAFGLANIEAIASGLPVIASGVGGIPEVIEDGETGLLVQPGDAQSLAEQMESLGDQPERVRKLGEAGRRRVLERFSMDRMVEETFQVYTELLGGSE